MRHEDYTYGVNGFAGHLAEPDQGSEYGVIVVMGGEQSLLPGIKSAERFADYGITGLAVSLFGADGLPEGPDRIPVDMFEPAVNVLRQKGITHLSIMGQSMGSVFAILAAKYIGGFENVILISPTHVPFEGVGKDRKTMSGHSMAVWKGKEIPFVRADFSKGHMTSYRSHPAVNYQVTNMWAAYYDAYRNDEKDADMHIEELNADILMIAGEMDESWPSSYSVRYMEKRLQETGYAYDVKTVYFPHGSHLCALMLNQEREKKLYRMMPVIGLMYRSFGKYRKDNLGYIAEAEREITSRITGKEINMTRHDEIRASYKQLGGSGSLYDGIITRSTVIGKILDSVVWGLDEEKAAQWINDALSPVPDTFDGRLLEVPVGTGVLTMPLYQKLKDAEITCLDYSADMMKNAENRAEAMNIKNVSFVQGDVGKLPFEDETFDIVLSLNGFHAFPDKEAAYREVYRVLKKGGMFCGCFYIEKEYPRTDFFVNTLYVPKGFFTPPFESKASLKRRLENMYSSVEVHSVNAEGIFCCIK